MTHSAGMAYFFQTHLKQKTIAARYTSYPEVSLPTQNYFLIQNGYFFKLAQIKTRLRYTNYPLISIPSQNSFAIRAS